MTTTDTATHSITTRYTDCGHEVIKAQHQNMAGDAPSAGFLRMMGKSMTETPTGWEMRAIGQCQDCVDAATLSPADCPHATQHIQDGDIVCAACHAYLGATDTPVEMTLAQAQVVYDNAYYEPVCPAHAPHMEDCECHTCMAQVCDCPPPLFPRRWPGITPTAARLDARLADADLNLAAVLRQQFQPEQQNQQGSVVPLAKPLDDWGRGEAAAKADVDAGNYFRIPAKMNAQFQGGYRMGYTAAGFIARRPNTYGECDYCGRSYRIRAHHCEAPWNPCDECTLCRNCVPCANCGMMDCTPRGSCR